MTETQLIELLRVLIRAECDAKEALARIDAEQERLTERMDAAHTSLSAVRKDYAWTKFRLHTVIAGKDDPGANRDDYTQRMAERADRSLQGVP